MNAELESLSSSTNSNYARLQAARSLKNNLIGSRHKKKVYSAFGAIPLLVSILEKNYDDNQSAKDNEQEAFLIQCTAALGSFACENDTTAQVVEAGAISILFKLLSSSNAKLVETASRPLRDLLLSSSTVIPVELILSSNDRIPWLLVQLLNHASELVNETMAIVIARLCKESRALIDAFLAASAIPAIIELLGKSSPRTTEPALAALAAVTTSHQGVENSSLLNSIITIVSRALRDQRPRVRLLAASVFANFKSSSMIRTSADENLANIKTKVVPSVVRLIGVNFQDDNKSLNGFGEIVEDAGSVLSRLVEGNEDLQRIATEGEAVSKLASLLKEKDKLRLSPRQQTNVMSALAALTFTLEAAQRQLASLNVLPLIVQSLSSPHPSQRAAASRVIHSMSRSALQLRTSLVDAAAAEPVMKLLSDPDIDVLIAASSAMCNLVLDVSAVKASILDNKGVYKLVNLVSSSYPTSVRVNGIWALKNLVFLADRTVKKTVLEVLTFDVLMALLADRSLEIQEQCLGLARNLVFKDMEQVFTDEQIHILINRVELVLHSSTATEDSLKHGLYILSNLANGPERYKQSVMRDSIVARLFELLSHRNAQLRLAAVWYATNIAWPDSDDDDADRPLSDEMDTAEDEAPAHTEPSNGSSIRIARLRELGWEKKIAELANDPDLDVRDRVKNCLSIFERAFDQPAQDNSD